MKEFIKFIKQWIIVWFTALVILCAGFYVFIKARSPDSTWLTAQSWDTLTAEKRNNMIPTTMVGAFLSTTCPAWRKPADGTNSTIDLRGQFLRGLNTFDNGSTTRSDGNQDPDGGSRSVWSYESDSFQWHIHNLEWNWFNNWWSYDYRLWRQTETNTTSRNTRSHIRITSPVSDWTNWTPRISSETRGRNIAIIFCVRK